MQYMHRTRCARRARRGGFVLNTITDTNSSDTINHVRNGNQRGPSDFPLLRAADKRATMRRPCVCA